MYKIEIVKKDGSSYDPPAVLLDVFKSTGQTVINKFEVVRDKDGYIEGFRLENNPNLYAAIDTLGKLPGLIESFGYVDIDTGELKGYLPEFMDELNKLTKAFVEEFNKVHRDGYNIYHETKIDFFEFTDPDSPPAQAVKVRDEILNDPGKIAASKQSEEPGNNENARELAEVKTRDLSEYGIAGSFDSYYASIIGDLGVFAQGRKKDLENTQVLLDSVEYNRQSVSGVSLDEEMTNIITFQHAYNASARMVNVIDEMLDRIINGMGLAGR